MRVVAGRYEVIRELGRGGMGEVLLARQLALGRLVVIKRVLAEDSPESVRALLEEARIAAQLSHPAIVGVLDVSATPPYIAMEYVPGLTLREMIPASGIPLAIALTITLDVVRGLVYAHRSGVLHRDIKPRNIMVTFNGHSKLIDFGISRWVSTDGVWESTSLAGTPGYMAPELMPRARLDGRIDEFALGVTLREMLLGRDPQAALVRPGAPEATAPRRPQHDAPDPRVPPPLAGIIERATAANADDRYPSCAELLAALEDAAKLLGVAPSHDAVERHIREHHADRIEAWHRDSSNALRSEAPTDPPAAVHPPTPAKLTQQASERTKAGYAETKVAETEDTSATSARTNVATGSSSARAVRRPRSWLPWIGAATIAIGLATAGVLVMRRVNPPARSIVSVVVKQTGTADDTWLGLAIENIVALDLRDAPGRHFDLASKHAPATIPIELAYQRTPHGVVLEARRRGNAALLAHAEATSVVAASAALVPQLVERLPKSGPSGPDRAEAEQMAKLGARSYDQYRRLRAVSERLRVSGYHDPSFAVGELRVLVNNDPAWPRPYAELGNALVKRGEGLATVAEGMRRGDRARDPDGMKVLEAFTAVEQGRWADAEQLAAPVFARNDADLVAGEVTHLALWGLDRDDESRAVIRRLYEKFPGLHFGGDVIAAFDREARRDQARELAHQIIAAHPENVSAMRELVRIEADRGDLDEARRIAMQMVLVHGVDSGLAYADLFEAMLAIDDLATAHQLVDAMLLGSPLARARGLYRAAVVAVHEGRFNLARARLTEALVAFDGITDAHTERPQCLALLRDIARIEGDKQTQADALRDLAGFYLVNRSATAEYLYREQVVRTAKCPAIEPYLADLALDARDQERARRALTRARADAGCGTCAEVIAAGVGNHETTNDSLISFATCARATGDLQLAKRVAQIATGWSSWASSADASPLYAKLAHYHLAEVLAQLGDTAGARRHYDRFLLRWGDMTKPIPEIAKAKAARAALPL